ncbi:MAG: sensor histidine kinase [Verrucomicrobiales bacterium]|nr:sensor histidine kinase [Verrucomicrobiales bacterium]
MRHGHRNDGKSRRRLHSVRRVAGGFRRGWLALLLALTVVGDLAGLEPDGRRVLALPERAWVRFGDDPAWAAPELGTNGWTEVRLVGALRRQGVVEDPGAAFLWYRVELPGMRLPEGASLNVFLDGVSGATQGFINGRPTAQTPQDFTGRVGARPCFPPPGFPQSFRIRPEQWRHGGRNLLAIRVQRAPRAAGVEEGVALMGYAIAVRPFIEATHRWNDLWEGMALAGLTLALLTATGLGVADRMDGLSRGLIPVFLGLAAQVVLNSHALVRTPWAGPVTMRAGWAVEAVVLALCLAVAGRFAGRGRGWTVAILAAAVPVTAGLVLSTEFAAMRWAQLALTVFASGAALIAVWWAVREAASAPSWLRPLRWGIAVLLSAWAVHLGAAQLGRSAAAAATRPHTFSLGLAGLFFATLVLRLRAAVADYRRLLRANLDAQENERRRIARDLHDGVGQALQALKLRLQLERRQRGETAPEATEPGPDTVTAIDGCIQELRAVAGNLRPVYLGRMPLAEALRQQGAQFARDSGIEVQFETEASLRLPAEAGDHLFRIQQEALTNAARHGRPQRIRIRLDASGDTLTLRITDDGGPQSPPLRAGRATGHGLRNMRERAELLGGQLQFARSAGGAAVTVTIPRHRIERAPATDDEG